MEQLYKKAFETLSTVLKIHLSNKGTDPTHHEFTNVYNDLLVIAHDIGEKLSDTGKPLLVESNEDFRREVYESIEGLKSDIEDFIESEKVSIGADNMLRGMADELEGMCNKANSFVVEFEQEEEEDKNEEPETKPVSMNKIMVPKK